MPKPIVCLSDVLCQFLESFDACFSQRQRKYFVTVLLGLVESEGHYESEKVQIPSAMAVYMCSLVKPLIRCFIGSATGPRAKADSHEGRGHLPSSPT